MHQNPTDIIESLLTSNHRLTRMAAQSTGSTVSAAVWSSLSILNTDGPRRNGELARAARISQPGMTKLLANLVEDEWVYRIADVDDSRAWLIAITDEGRAALSDWRTQLAVATRAIFGDLSETEWTALDRAAAILAVRLADTAVAA
ncbi:MAG: MarR family transcriptional regulator [Microbacteriaceae bacterium]|jgi:DNA-binding MarR family transcriptional regulator|nr:MarR family transcriptional regulator [Microbacteriaceae bacterium]